MGGVIGLDVGGANTKAVWRNGGERRTVSRPFEVWRDREALVAVLREVVAGVAPEPVERMPVTSIRVMMPRSPPSGADGRNRTTAAA